MKQQLYLKAILGAFLVVCFLSVPSFAAEDLEKRVDELEKELKAIKETKIGTGKTTTEDQTKWYEYIKIGAYLDSSYSYNFRNPQNPAPFIQPTSPMRIFDNNATGFRFNLFQLALSSNQSAWPEWLGFSAKIDFGQDAKAIASRGFDTGDDVEIQSAFVNLTAPLGNGLTFRVGKWETLLGAEVIESIDNYNFSRSFLFSFAIPATHLGVLATYPVIKDKLAVSAGVVNGWDTVNELGHFPSYIAQIAITPNEKVSFLINGIIGPEDSFGVERDSIYRGVIDLVLLVNPTPKLALSLNYDYGREGEAVAQFVNGVQLMKNRHAEWQGFSGIIAYDFTKWFQLAYRGEWFRDTDGYRTAGQLQPPFIATGITFNDNNMWENTVTATFTVYKDVKLRAEYRHDSSSLPVFVKDFIAVKTQDTLAAEVMLRF